MTDRPGRCSWIPAASYLQRPVQFPQQPDKFSDELAHVS